MKHHTIETTFKLGTVKKQITHALPIRSELLYEITISAQLHNDNVYKISWVDNNGHIVKEKIF